MATVTIDDPDLHERKQTDSQGRVYLGTDFQETDVTIVVERQGDD